MQRGARGQAAAVRRAGPARAPALCALLLAAAPAAAGTPADARCQQASSAERLARELERAAERRARFLQGTGQARPGAAGGHEASAARATGRGWVDEVRALRPQLREAAAAARHDRGSVPGLGDWFQRLEANLERAAAGVEACLAAPGRCSPPALSCPPPPPMPAPRANGSAAFTRQIQGAYAQWAEQARQACRALGEAVRQDLERAARAERTAVAAAPGGGADLYAPRIQSLRREASRHRQEADRLSGTAAYCAAGPRSRPSPSKGPRPAPPAREGPDPRAVDLSATWAGGFSAARRLAAPVAPLPRVPGDDAESGAERRSEVARSGSPAPPWWSAALAGRPAAGEGGGAAAWLEDRWRAAREAYRDADRQVELSEFLLERPAALAADVVTALVEQLPYGKTVVTGHKLLGAVRDTTEEVLQIASEAPAVLAHGGEAETRALARRAFKAPVNFLDAVFDDVTGKFPGVRDPEEAPGE